MARHAHPAQGGRPGGGRRRLRPSLPTIAGCVLVVVAVALGVWWWTLQSASDPIAADPVDAYAVVVSSPSCPGGNGTRVRISGIDPPVTATLSGCGWAVDQRLAVQYLKGHPQQIRLAGTTVAGGSGLGDKLLPIGILTAGVIAVLAAVALLTDRRRSRHLASASRIRVSDLRRRGPGSARAGSGRGAAASGDEVAGDARPADGDGSAGAGDGRPGSGAHRDPEADGTAADLDAIDPGEPSHILPGGFVIVDEQLFTHSGTEAITAPEQDRGDGSAGA